MVGFDWHKSNLQCGLSCAEADDRDLIWCLEDDRDIAQIADFLCRTPSEICARMAELGLSRKLHFM
jgi:hypothetical protein